MKKVLLCIIALAILSCSSDDDATTIENTIRFNLNGEDYVLTAYTARIDPTNNVNRIVEVSFDDNTRTLRFFMEVGETGKMGQIVLLEEAGNRISDSVFGDRETNITLHTDTKMEGTFRVTFEDSFGEPVYTFTNGSINISY